MVFNIEAFIWYLLVIDSVSANIMAFCCGKWYKKKFKRFSKYFPMVQGWTVYYLVLVLWAGSILWRMGMLPW
tara:strand:- start:462 stop:677 length:216 start_codon:yes stop_codon:yes gene_type:complete